MLIVIEGVDCVGKTTACLSLLEKVREVEFAAMMSFPRYGTWIGGLINSWLVNGNNLKYPNAFQALMATDKHDATKEILGILSRGSLVLSRYWQSAVAYGAASDVSFESTIAMHEGLPAPDLSILLDMSTDDALERRPEKRDAYESNPSFLREVRKHYLDIWASPPENHGEWVIVNAAQQPDDVLKDVWGHVSRTLEKKRARVQKY